MKPSIFTFAILFAASSLAHAQQQGPRWGLGLGTAVSGAVYAGEDTRLTPFPLVSYQGERFYWRGIGGGAHIMKRGGFSPSAALTRRCSRIATTGSTWASRVLGAGPWASSNSL